MSRFSFPADTSPEALRVMYDAIRKLTSQQRWEQVDQLNESARAMLAAGVRSRHPEYTDRQVHQAMIRLWLGDEVYREAYPGQDIEV